MLETIGQTTEVNQFKQELLVWANKSAPIVARAGAGLSDELFEELAYTSFIVSPLIVAKDSDIPIDKLCFGEIHNNKNGSIPFFRKLKLSPPV